MSNLVSHDVFIQLECGRAANNDIILPRILVDGVHFNGRHGCMGKSSIATDTSTILNKDIERFSFTKTELSNEGEHKVLISGVTSRVLIVGGACDSSEFKLEGGVGPLVVEMIDFQTNLSIIPILSSGIRSIRFAENMKYNVDHFTLDAVI